jgi:hypothetical protein
VTIWIVTFSKHSPILFRRKEIRVQPVGGAKSIAPRHVYLRHLIAYLLWKV